MKLACIVKIVNSLLPPMSERMHHYLLTPLEAELLACFRLIDEQTKIAMITLISAQIDQGCHKLDNPVEIRIVKK